MLFCMKNIKQFKLVQQVAENRKKEFTFLIYIQWRQADNSRQKGLQCTGRKTSDETVKGGYRGIKDLYQVQETWTFVFLVYNEL